jgi:CBS domain-containing protein
MPTDRTAPNPRQPLARRIGSEPIKSLMQSDPLVVGRQEPVAAVLVQMRERKVSCALVCEGDRLVGIFTERDYLDRIAGSPELLAQPITDFMSPDPDALQPSASLAELLELIVRRGRRHLPVVQSKRLVGLVAARDIVKYIADLFPTEVYNLPPRLDQIISEVDGA